MERFARTYAIRWADCDVNGHMRNTAYSEYATETRIAFLAAGGFPFQRFVEHRFGPVILREEIDYLREVRLGEELRVDLAILGLSPDGARFRFAHDLWLPGGTKAARLVLAGGWLDLEARRLRPPPEPLRLLMEQAERADGFEALPPLPGGR